MRFLHWLMPAALFVLLACQPGVPANVTIIDNGQIYSLTTSERIPSSLLTQAGIQFTPADQVLFNGYAVPSDQPIPSAKTYTLQVHHAVTLTVNGQSLQTTARTVGEALMETGTKLYTADRLDPPADTPVSDGMMVTYTPSQELNVSTDGRQVRIRSAAGTVGAALAEAGIPLLSLDTSQPSGNETLPTDGQIHVTRVTESLVLAEKSIPFKSDFQASAKVELDHQEILQPGQPGLSVSRTRIRYEDGKEVSRQTESETVVRSPKDRIVGYGTKVVLHTTTVNGVQIKYWRAVQMYATAYSPCNSGVSGQCSSGTSIGLPAGKGVVAVDPSLYSYFAGQNVFIPGYGAAVIGDVGGGYIIEQKLGIPRKRWIDLGFSDAECSQACDQWGKYVTVYFLAPIPSNVLYVLQ